MWLVAATLMVQGQTARSQQDNKTDWNPARTWVFSVDVLLYEGDREEDIPATWLEIPASALVDQFRRIGVPADQIVVLQRKEASAANLELRFAQMMQRTRPGDLLVFYFSGHSGRNTLSLHDKSIQKSLLIQAIESQFRGDRAMLFIDSCYSGGVAELVRETKTRVSYAVLTSTFAQQTARSGCRFYMCMLRGLGGNPVVDLDRNGVVTFKELSEYTTKYMAFAAEGKPTTVTTGAFAPNFRIALANGKAGPLVGELVERNRGGKWHKAEILENTPRGLVLHYTKNTKPDDDEVVHPSVLRKPVFPQLRKGQRVEVYSGVSDRWHDATVLDDFESLHFCRLDGLPPTNNEWFGPSRIRQLVGSKEFRELRRWEGVFQGPNGMKLTIDDDDWLWTTGDPKSTSAGMIRVLGVTDKWTRADLIVQAGPQKGKTIRAIFRLEGDTLKYCGTYRNTRPTEFKDSKENEQLSMDWVRVKR